MDILKALHPPPPPLFLLPHTHPVHLYTHPGAPWLLNCHCSEITAFRMKHSSLKTWKILPSLFFSLIGELTGSEIHNWKWLKVCYLWGFVLFCYSKLHLKCLSITNNYWLQRLFHWSADAENWSEQPFLQAWHTLACQSCAHACRNSLRLCPLFGFSGLFCSPNKGQAPVCS